MESTSPGQLRCTSCFRPSSACLCATLPTVENRTEVVILQHRRERKHPFNTARLVARSLRNAQFLVGHKHELEARAPLSDGAALLYPGPDAELLDRLPVEKFPKQLVIVDGTWHHAKTLVRDLPVLRQLPRVKLAPSRPSEYQIRREPNAQALSTLEAVVSALRVLEPETGGLEELMMAFRRMIARQLSHPRSAAAPRFASQGKRSWQNVPLVFADQLQRVVVAYGESAEGGPRHAPAIAKKRLPPIYWVAERLVSEERFGTTIRPDQPMDETFLNHLELTQAHFEDALSLADASAHWRAFLRPHDVVVVYHGGAARLHEQLTGGSHPCLILKSIDVPPDSAARSLEELVAREQPSQGPTHFAGRAGRRLANAITFVQFLHGLAAAQRTDQPQ